MLPKSSTTCVKVFCRVSYCVTSVLDNPIISPRSTQNQLTNTLPIERKALLRKPLRQLVVMRVCFLRQIENGNTRPDFGTGESESKAYSSSSACYDYCSVLEGEEVED